MEKIFLENELKKKSSTQETSSCKTNKSYNIFPQNTFMKIVPSVYPSSTRTHRESAMFKSSSTESLELIEESKKLLSELSDIGQMMKSQSKRLQRFNIGLQTDSNDTDKKRKFERDIGKGIIILYIIRYILYLNI